MFLRRSQLSLCLVLLSSIQLLACSNNEAASSPSIVLVVMDTVRADAVSAPAAAPATTPEVDRLARKGVFYERAYSQAPWTLPSHASLFSGLPTERHGVNARHPLASEDLVMLAERLAEAGYATAGVSENPWISAATRMVQGFEWFRPVLQVGEDGEMVIPLDRAPGLVEEWLDSRTDERPFFLFLNFVDAHAPYLLRDSNAFLPPKAGAEQAQQLLDRPPSVCAAWPADSPEMAILHGLYLGGVAAADAKLARVLALLRERDAGGRLITIVTSDHGEHFGEHGLRDHFYSLHEELLHVPLVVHGAPSAEPGLRVAEPVALTDLVPTILQWVGLPIPEALPGRPLPVSVSAASQANAPRIFTAGFRDPLSGGSASVSPLVQLVMDRVLELRAPCPSDLPAGGDLRTALDYPLKLIEGAEPDLRLFDLQADPREQMNLAHSRPGELTRLRRALANPSATDSRPEGEAPILPESVVEALRALGYAPELPPASP